MLKCALKKFGDILALFLSRKNLLAQNQATKKMIRSLPKRALLCVRNGAVTMEISVPLSALLIGEVREGILVSLVIPLLIRFFTGKEMSDKRSYQSLVVYPPQLHIVLELLARSSIEITEVIYTTVLLIPTNIKMPVEYI